jgi:hypothetical protein
VVVVDPAPAAGSELAVGVEDRISEQDQERVDFLEVDVGIAIRKPISSPTRSRGIWTIP